MGTFKDLSLEEKMLRTKIAYDALFFDVAEDQGNEEYALSEVLQIIIQGDDDLLDQLTTLISQSRG